MIEYPPSRKFVICGALFTFGVVLLTNHSRQE